MKTRNWILKVHGYIGVFIGVLIAIIGLTGSLLVFHEPLETALHPAILVVKPQGELLPIDEIVAIAKNSVPESELTSIRLPKEANDPYQLYMELSEETGKDIYINPYTGSILGLWDNSRTLLRPILAIHTSLLAGEVGEVVVGLCALLLMVLVVTGTVLWPGWRKLSTGYKIRWQSARRLLFYDLHKVAGMVMGTFLFLTALTGAIIVLLHYSPQAIAFFLGPQPKTELLAISSNSKPWSLSEVLRVVDQTLPGSKTTRLSFSGEQHREVTVFREFPNDPLAARGGLSNVRLDIYTGEVLSTNKVEQPNVASNLANFILDFHFGTFAGIYSQILYVFMGISPILLLSTGLVLWRQKTWRKSHHKERRKLQDIVQAQQNQQSTLNVLDQDTILLPQEECLFDQAQHSTEENKKPALQPKSNLLNSEELDELARSLGIVIPPKGVTIHLKN